MFSSKIVDFFLIRFLILVMAWDSWNYSWIVPIPYADLFCVYQIPK